MTVRAAALALALLAASPATAIAAVEPDPRVTRIQGEIAFAEAVVSGCLTSQEQRTPIARLPEVHRTSLEPAQGEDLTFGRDRFPPGRVWISRVLGSHLHVLERAPDRCEVVADQLPVEETLRRTREVTLRLDPPFTQVEVKPSYNPVVYESRRAAGGRTIRIHLEGAEPGLPDHWSRFSLLQAVVTSEPSPGGAPSAP